jgi:hypothetical protein
LEHAREAHWACRIPDLEPATRGPERARKAFACARELPIGGRPVGLEAAVHRVLTVSNGAEAIQILNREPVRLSVTEGAHPGANGHEVSKLAAVQPGVPVVWMSSASYETFGV